MEIPTCDPDLTFVSPVEPVPGGHGYIRVEFRRDTVLIRPVGPFEPQEEAKRDRDRTISRRRAIPVTTPSAWAQLSAFVAAETRAALSGDPSDPAATVLLARHPHASPKGRAIDRRNQQMTTENDRENHDKGRIVSLEHELARFRASDVGRLREVLHKIIGLTHARQPGSLLGPSAALSQIEAIATDAIILGTPFPEP